MGLNGEANMLKNKTVAIVVPSYNVEKLVEKVVCGIPEWVDYIITVNDGSRDKTEHVLEQLKRKGEVSKRLINIKHNANKGVGAAIGTGYKWCREHKIDAAVVMAGDAQMDVSDLPNIVEPVISQETDYAKGNRLMTAGSFSKIPKVRFFGNSVLSLLTKVVSGYWHIADSQSGYTAISLEALNLLDLDDLYPRFGMPNDLLVKLNLCGMRVMDVPIKPIYNVGEKSAMKVHGVIFTISFLLARLFFKRMWIKYVVQDFHPLVLFYALGLVCLPVGILLGLSFLIFSAANHAVIPTGWLIVALMLILSGFQSLFFAMWFDMDYNRHLFIFKKKRT